MSVTEAMEEGEEEQPNLGDEAEEIGNEAKQVEEEYSWPVIRFDVPPHRAYHFCHQFRTPSNPNNFLKGVKWY